MEAPLINSWLATVVLLAGLKNWWTGRVIVGGLKEPEIRGHTTIQHYPGHYGGL